MTALRVVLKRINWGWAVQLTNGRELVRFTGPYAKRRALRYVAGFGREVGHAH
jgi:hypothetical protein